MSTRDYFILGCKLFGVYCLFLGIPSLIAIIPTFVQPEGLDADYRKLYTATAIATRLISIVYIGGGLFLIRGADRFYHFAYPQGSEAAEKSEENFIIFIKMLGIFLIISYFPDLLKTISSYIVYTRAPKVFNMVQEQQFAYLNAASSIWGVAFGFYLLRSGELITKMALRNISGTSGSRGNDDD